MQPADAMQPNSMLSVPQTAYLPPPPAYETHVHLPTTASTSITTITPTTRTPTPSIVIFKTPVTLSYGYKWLSLRGLLAGIAGIIQMFTLVGPEMRDKKRHISFLVFTSQLVHIFFVLSTMKHTTIISVYRKVMLLDLLVCFYYAISYGMYAVGEEGSLFRVMVIEAGLYSLMCFFLVRYISLFIKPSSQ